MSLNRRIVDWLLRGRIVAEYYTDEKSVQIVIAPLKKYGRE